MRTPRTTPAAASTVRIHRSGGTNPPSATARSTVSWRLRPYANSTIPSAANPVPMPTYAQRSPVPSLGAMPPVATPTARAVSAVRHHAR